MMIRKMSLTSQEHKYLGDLLVHGNEIEVQLAYEKLQDEELFFDHQSPKHYKGQPVFWENGPIPNDQTNGNADGRPTLQRSTSQGSQRRLQALEQRKNSIQHLTLWQAHQSGLVVTHNGSRNSLMRRSSTLGGSTSNHSTGPPRPPPSNAIFRQRQRRLLLWSSSRGMMPAPHRPGSSARVYKRSQLLSLLPPPIPPPSRLSRRSLTNSSRKSVTFHKETNGTPKPRTKKTLRRTVSDSNAMSIRPITETDVPNEQGGESGPLLAQRQESTSSIPSIHHAHPIRQDSVSSIPSLHHGHPIRQDSVSTIPSLHQGHPIRQDSVSTIPSLHHGTMLQEQSLNNVALHSSARSIPSLHHGHPLMDDGSTTVADSIPPQYATSDNVANTWLQQQHQQQQTPPPPPPPAPQPLDTRDSSLGSLPHNVTIPHNTTDETYLSTAGTVTTTASTAARSEDGKGVPHNGSAESPSKPVLMRLATRNAYEGDGIEVTEMDDEPLMEQEESMHASTSGTFPGMISMDVLIRTCNSWDTALSSYHPHPEIFRGGSIFRSLSDDDNVGPIFFGSGANILFMETSLKLQDGQQISGHGELEDDTSWDMTSDDEVPRQDSWNVLKDEYINGYGGGGSLDFLILGTDADDIEAQPHVLSPPLMESLQAFLPLNKSGQNFHLKYSMVRDGASLHTFLKRARGVQYAILGLETVDGKVFGRFTAQPWRKNWNYFGNGESFLWRMRQSRLEKTHDILEQAHLESEIDVFPYTGENKLIQLCTHDRIAMGGGTPAEKKVDNDTAIGSLTSNDVLIQPHEWGFELAISGDLLSGTSSPCMTFGSPSLSMVHSKGTMFEIANMELWTMTPCMTVEDAEKLELGKLFLERRN